MKITAEFSQQQVAEAMLLLLAKNGHVDGRKSHDVQCEITVKNGRVTFPILVTVTPQSPETAR